MSTTQLERMKWYDTVRRFVEARLEKVTGESVGFTEIWQAYQEWSAEDDVARRMSKYTLARILGYMGWERGTGGRYRDCRIREGAWRF